MPFAKFAPELELRITLDHDAPFPLQKQLMEQVRNALLDGRLPAGTRLPSTRALAQALGVSRTVTAWAYDELFAEGYIEGRQGSGTYVGRDLPVLPRPSSLTPSGRPRWLKQPAPPNVETPSAPDTIAFRLGMALSCALSSSRLARGMEKRDERPATQLLWSSSRKPIASGGSCRLSHTISQPNVEH